MNDVMSALKERKAKAVSRLARAEKALESARKDLDDVLAAERVLAAITGEVPESKPSESGVSDRDVAIAKIIPSEPERALSPADLHRLYLEESDNTISLETFRTAVWRLLKKVVRGNERSWVVKSKDGKYWREPVDEPRDDFDQLLDDDSDVPY